MNTFYSFFSTSLSFPMLKAAGNDTPVLLYGVKERYSHIPTEPFKLVETDDVLTPVTFVDSRESLAEYFFVLDKNYTKFIDHQFDFSRYRLKDSIKVVDWLEQNNIFNEV